MVSRSLDLGKLGPLDRIGSGGQGVVYKTSGIRLPYAMALVFKEYKQSARAGLDVSVLELMPAYLESLPMAEGMELLSRVAWPCQLVTDAGSVVGFVMPAIPPEFYIDIRKARGMASTVAEFQHLLNSASFLARRQIPITDQHRYELLSEAAEALGIFHRHNLAVGDFSPKNLLFSLNPHRRVYFLDADAMRFQGQSVTKQIETPDWEVRIANQNETLATHRSDAYKLGLLALRLLAGSQQTRNVNDLPSNVPKPVRRLVTGALHSTPSQRPAPADWIQPLKAAAARASTARPPQPKHSRPTPAHGSNPSYPVAPAPVIPTPPLPKAGPSHPPSYPVAPAPATPTKPKRGRVLTGVFVVLALVGIAATSFSLFSVEDPYFWETSFLFDWISWAFTWDSSGFGLDLVRALGPIITLFLSYLLATSAIGAIKRRFSLAALWILFFVTMLSFQVLYLVGVWLFDLATSGPDLFRVFAIGWPVWHSVIAFLWFVTWD